MTEGEAMKPTLAEYLVEIKARRERYLELCDEAGVPLDEWAAHEAILAFDSHAEGDIEALMGMVEVAKALGTDWETTPVPIGYQDAGDATARVACGEDLLEALEAHIPEEKTPSTPPNAS